MLSFLTSSLALVSLVSVVRAVDHQVVVGGTAGLVYTPSNITAAVGQSATLALVPCTLSRLESRLS